MSSFPKTIEAFAIQKTGGIEVLEKLTMPFPKVEPDHLVIKVEYFGINFIDTYYRQGLYPLPSLPAVMGKETSGEIIAMPTDSNVLNDPDFQRMGYKLGGKVASDFLGTHSSYISIPWLKAYPIPHGISTKVAAAGLIQGLTTITFFEEAYRVKKGDVILIYTVAGGLGLLMTQLAKHIGATVIGTTSTKDKSRTRKAHGADHVILYKDEDTVKRVLEITKGVGVDAVFDGVGKDTFDDNFEILRRKGTLVSVGNASGAVLPGAPLKLTPKNLTLLRPYVSDLVFRPPILNSGPHSIFVRNNNYVVTPDEIYYYGTKLFELISNGVFKINIFKEYAFTQEEGQQAQKDLVGGKTTGKLLIKVAHD